jgi:hypothetical protein
MATGNIRGGKRNYARPTAPSTTTVTASTTQAEVTYSITPSTLGPTATSYVITGTSNDGGTAINTTVTSTSGTATGWSAGKNYSVSLAAQNYNGVGASGGVTTLSIPNVYELVLTANNTQNYTIPSGKTKLAGIVISAGGSGGGAVSS